MKATQISVVHSPRNTVLELEGSNYFSGYTINDIKLRHKLLERNASFIKDTDVVYFPKFNKFPRFKLSNTNLKRTIKIDKASLIVSDFEHINNNCTSVYIIMFYSKSKDEYYYINTFTYRSVYNYKIFKMIEESKNEMEFATKLIALAIEEELVPEDTAVSFLGDFVKSVEEVDNLIQSIMTIKSNVVTSNTLDEFVNSKLDNITPEEILEVDNLLSSPDPNVVSLGIKILSGFNVMNSKLMIILLLANNVKNLRYNKAINSVAFTQLQKSLGIDLISMFNNTLVIDRTISESYSESNNEKDKELCKEYLAKIVIKKLMSQFETITRYLEPFGFKAKINIE